MTGEVVTGKAQTGAAELRSGSAPPAGWSVAAESDLLPDQFDRTLGVVDGLAAKLR